MFHSESQNMKMEGSSEIAVQLSNFTEGENEAQWGGRDFLKVPQQGRVSAGHLSPVSISHRTRFIKGVSEGFLKWQAPSATC